MRPCPALRRNRFRHIRHCWACPLTLRIRRYASGPDAVLTRAEVAMAENGSRRPEVTHRSAYTKGVYFLIHNQPKGTLLSNHSWWGRMRKAISILQLVLVAISGAIFWLHMFTDINLGSFASASCSDPKTCIAETIAASRQASQNKTIIIWLSGSFCLICFGALIFASRKQDSQLTSPAPEK